MISEANTARSVVVCQVVEVELLPPRGWGSRRLRDGDLLPLQLPVADLPAHRFGRLAIAHAQDQARLGHGQHCCGLVFADAVFHLTNRLRGQDHTSAVLAPLGQRQGDGR